MGHPRWLSPAILAQSQGSDSGVSVWPWLPESPESLSRVGVVGVGTLGPELGAVLTLQTPLGAPGGLGGHAQHPFICTSSGPWTGPASGHSPRGQVPLAGVPVTELVQENSAGLAWPTRWGVGMLPPYLPQV